MNNAKILRLSLLTAALAAALSASAVTTFVDRLDWLQAASGRVVFTERANDVPEGTSFRNRSVQLNGFSVYGVAPQPADHAVEGGALRLYSSGDGFVSDPEVAEYDVLTFDRPALGFGGDFSSTETGAPTAYLSFVDGTTEAVEVETGGYFGFLSDLAVTRVELRGPYTGTYYLDDAHTAYAPVPEPATAAVLGLGLLALRRRRDAGI